MTELNWRDPPLISAKSWKDPSKLISVRVSEDITGKNIQNWRRTPLYCVWAHLLGQLPPFTNASIAQGDGVSISFTTLEDATACFMGVKRPYMDRDNGENVLTYVLPVSGTVEYHPRMAAPIRGAPVPQDVVLTVQVCLTDPLQNDDTGLCGTVTRMEFVRSEAGTNLPVDHFERYGNQCW